MAAPPSSGPPGGSRVIGCLLHHAEGYIAFLIPATQIHPQLLGVAPDQQRVTSNNGAFPPWKSSATHATQVMVENDEGVTRDRCLQMETCQEKIEYHGYPSTGYHRNKSMERQESRFSVRTNYRSCSREESRENGARPPIHVPVALLPSADNSPGPQSQTVRRSHLLRFHIEANRILIQDQGRVEANPSDQTVGGSRRGLLGDQQLVVKVNDSVRYDLAM